MIRSCQFLPFRYSAFMRNHLQCQNIITRLSQNNELLATLNAAYAQALAHEPPRRFRRAPPALLTLTGSEAAFIGETRPGADDRPALKSISSPNP
jgi:hypothetical protein